MNMEDYEPTQEELEDAICSDTCHCDLCWASFVLGGCPDYVIVESPVIVNNPEPREWSGGMAQLTLCGYCAGLVAKQYRENLMAAGICEHGLPDTEYCEPCNKEYKRAAREAGYEEDTAR